MAKPNLAPILERLNQAGGYHPFSADVFTDWSQEAGDVVTIKKGDDTYASPIHVSKVKWAGHSRLQINADGNESRDAIAKVSRKKYGRGSSGMYNNSRIYHEMSDYYGALTSKIEMTESHLIVEFDQMYNGLHSEIVSTASIFQVNLDNYYEGLSSTITATASKFSVDLNNAYQGLSSSITATASKFSVDLSNAYQGLSSSITATASKFSVDLSNAYQGLSSSITATASKIETEIRNNYSGLSSRLTQTDSKINAEVRRSTNKDTELEGQLLVEAGRVGMLVTVTDNRTVLPYQSIYNFPATGDSTKIYLDVSTGKYYEWKNGGYSELENGPGQKINAGGIVTQINEDDEIETHINSDKVYIGNQKSTTVINGKCTLAEVTADIVKSRIENISLVNVQAIAGSNGSAYCHLNEFKGNYYKVNIPGGGGSVSTNDLCDGVYDLQIVQSGNTYTLQKRNIKSSSWVDVGSFSRAASTLLVPSWGGDSEPKHLIVTATPQNEKYYEYFTTGAKQNEDGTAYTSGNVWYVPIYGYPQGTPPAYTQIMRVKVDRGTSLSGDWQSDGTGSSNTYKVKATPQNDTNSVVVSERLSGNAQYSNFVAEFGTYSGNNFTRRGYTQGYLVITQVNGTYYVDVNSASNGSGSVYARKDCSSIYNAGYAVAQMKTEWQTSTGVTNANKLKITKVSSGGSTGPLEFVVSAGATIVWDSTNYKYKAVAKAKVDNAQRGDSAEDLSGVISIVFNAISGSCASAKRTVSIYDGNTERIKSGDLTDYGDGYKAAMNTIVWPGAIQPPETERTDFGVIVPISTGSTTLSFSLVKGNPSANGGYATLKKGGDAIARISLNNWWTDAYTAGAPASASLGSHVGTGTTWTVVVKKGDNGTVNCNVDMSSVYSAARSGYYLPSQLEIGGSFRSDGYADLSIWGNGTQIKNYTNKMRVWPDLSSQSAGTSATFYPDFGQYMKLNFTNPDGYSWTDIAYACKMPDNPYPQAKTMKCTKAEFLSSEWHYHFEYVNSNANMFTTNKNYKFHNNSGYT